LSITKEKILKTKFFTTKVFDNKVFQQRSIQAIVKMTTRSGLLYQKNLSKNGNSGTSESENKPSHVHGVKYESLVKGTDSLMRLLTCIFLPEFHMNLCSDGRVETRQEPLQTWEAYESMDKYLHFFHQFGLQYDDSDIKRITTAANKNAFISVTLPIDVVNVILDFHTKMQDDNTTQGQAKEYKKNLEDIVKKLVLSL